MALIDEYKQAIQDVLDGRAPAAPKPSELPWTEDKAATMWAAAAAELIAEANGGDALPDDPGTDGTYNLQNTVSSGTGTLSWASGGSSGGVLVVHWNSDYTALDKTGQEILTAVQTGPVFLIEIGDLEDGGEVIVYMLQGVFKENGTYYFAFSNKNAANNVRCSSLSDYPEYYEP